MSSVRVRYRKTTGFAVGGSFVLFRVEVGSAELAAMGMTPDELRASLVRTLEDSAVDADGASVEYPNLVVEIEVMPSAEEFAASLRASGRAGGGASGG